MLEERSGVCECEGAFSITRPQFWKCFLANAILAWDQWHRCPRSPVRCSRKDPTWRHQCVGYQGASTPTTTRWTLNWTWTGRLHRPWNSTYPARILLGETCSNLVRLRGCEGSMCVALPASGTTASRTTTPPAPTVRHKTLTPAVHISGAREVWLSPWPRHFCTWLQDDSHIYRALLRCGVTFIFYVCFSCFYYALGHSKKKTSTGNQRWSVGAESLLVRSENIFCRHLRWRPRESLTLTYARLYQRFPQPHAYSRALYMSMRVVRSA